MHFVSSNVRLSSLNWADIYIYCVQLIKRSTLDCTFESTMWYGNMQSWLRMTSLQSIDVSVLCLQFLDIL